MINIISLFAKYWPLKVQKSLRGIRREVWARVERVQDVAEDQPVDNVQQDEGGGEEDPWHAVLQVKF